MTDNQPCEDGFNEANVVLLLSDDDGKKCGVIHRESSILIKKSLFSEDTDVLTMHSVALSEDTYTADLKSFLNLSLFTCTDEHQSSKHNSRAREFFS